VFYSIIGGPFQEFIEAAVIHDWLCEHPEIYSRIEADYIFLEIMEKLGVEEWKRDAMWRAVSLMEKGDIDNFPEIKTIND